jgi:hypothetical protein
MAQKTQNQLTFPFITLIALKTSRKRPFLLNILSFLCRYILIIAFNIMHLPAGASAILSFVFVLLFFLVAQLR